MKHTDWMEPKQIRPMQEAVDEVFRELNVRKRCFPMWVRDGRVSATDAQDRLDRLATAHEALVKLLEGCIAPLVTSSGDKTRAAAAV